MPEAWMDGALTWRKGCVGGDGRQSTLRGSAQRIKSQAGSRGKNFVKIFTKFFTG